MTPRWEDRPRPLRVLGKGRVAHYVRDTLSAHRTLCGIATGPSWMTLDSLDPHFDCDSCLRAKAQVQSEMDSAWIDSAPCSWCGGVGRHIDIRPGDPRPHTKTLEIRDDF